MKAFAHGLILNLQFFTKIPLPFTCELRPVVWRWCLRLFPLSGILIGGILFLVRTLTGSLFPPFLLPPLLLTLWIFLTGGLHLDGWADLGDALGSNASLAGKQAIMKDPRLGTFGFLSLFFLVGWKGLLLYLSLNLLPPVLLIFIPALARFQALWLLHHFKPYQNTGLAHTFKEHLQPMDVAISLMFILPFLFIQPQLLILAGIQLAGSFCFGRRMTKQLGGINGDVLGASIEGAELWNLAVLAISIWFATG